jgi:hypothetical protein
MMFTTAAVDGSSPWHLLPPIVGSGNMTNIVADPGTNAPPLLSA